MMIFHIIIIVYLYGPMSIVMAEIGVPIIGVTAIAVVIDVQVIRGPANPKCCCYAPENPSAKTIIPGVGIVVARVGARVIGVDRVW